MTVYRPFVLIICDGWGYSAEKRGNAIAAAHTPHFDALTKRWPSALAMASGEAVGLPEGQQGNSEVGHLTIGAGRVIFQDLTRISKQVADGSFYDNAVLRAAVDRARERGGTMHCLGLVSPGGVHSHASHAIALAELARRRNLHRVVFHAFTDGRDVPPTSAAGDLRAFVAVLNDIGIGEIGSVSGRYYAMDRDHRWDRTQRAYEAIVGDGGNMTMDPITYIEQCYARGITDEFIEPASVVTHEGKPAPMSDSDSVVFFNFRPDRARQLSHALCDEKFDAFPRHKICRDLHFASFSQYDTELPAQVAFPHEDAADTLGEVVSAHGLRQFHVAETEKYAHVTYFINGGREEPFPGEGRLLVPSPPVATYDAVPEMSAPGITSAVLDSLTENPNALTVVNFANPDMVGHTGNFDATVRAVEVVDGCIGAITDAVLQAGGAVLITADHGNAEYKINLGDGSPLTAHTTNPVPVVLCGTDITTIPAGGGLSDIAPLVLSCMGLLIPDAMTGRRFLL